MHKVGAHHTKNARVISIHNFTKSIIHQDTTNIVIQAHTYMTIITQLFNET
jgi:hypothetical protein